jgi:hypothetical protein
VHRQSRRQHAAPGDPAAIRGWGAPVLASVGGRPLFEARVAGPSLGTRPRGPPPRGGGSAEARGAPAAVRGPGRWGRWPAAGRGPCCAIAPLPPASARALAPGPTVAGCPREPRRRARFHRLPGACPRRSWRTWGGVSRRRGRGRLPGAGSREAPAPSTRTRRAGAVPAGGSAPWRRCGPAAYAAGSKPKHCIRALRGSTRVRSPMAAPGRTAAVPWAPRQACRASPPGGTRHAGPGAWRAGSRRWRRAGGACTARP